MNENKQSPATTSEQSPGLSVPSGSPAAELLEILKRDKQQNLVWLASKAIQAHTIMWHGEDPTDMLKEVEYFADKVLKQENSEARQAHSYDDRI